MRLPLHARASLGAGFVAVVLLATVHADSTPADIYLSAADSLAREWRYRDALVIYGRAEQAGEGPTRVRAALGVTTTAVRLAEFELAYAKAVQLRAANPGDVAVLAVYGQAAWSAGLFDEAEAAFRDVLAREPRNGRARLGMARVLLSRNRLDEALENGLTAAAVTPEDADPYSVVGTIYKRMQRVDQAILWYGKYLSMLPPREFDKRGWTQNEIIFLQSFGRRQPAEIDPQSLSAVHTMPFRLADGKVIVKGLVNEKEYVDFVVDTGAEETVLSATTARRFSVVPISGTISAGVGEVGLRGLQNATLESLQIGSLKVRNVPCLIKTPPLSDLPVRESESFSPLSLGLSVVLDYKRRQLVIGRSIPAEHHDVEIPIWFNRLATVRGLVNGERPVPFIVDTGGEVISISADTARFLPPPAARRVPVQVFGTSGWDRGAYLFPGVSLTFSDAVALHNSSVVVLNLRAPSVLLGYRIGGTIGHHLLGRYRLTIDLQRAIVGFDTTN